MQIAQRLWGGLAGHIDTFANVNIRSEELIDCHGPCLSTCPARSNNPRNNCAHALHTKHDIKSGDTVIDCHSLADELEIEQSLEIMSSQDVESETTQNAKSSVRFPKVYLS